MFYSFECVCRCLCYFWSSSSKSRCSRLYEINVFTVYKNYVVVVAYFFSHSARVEQKIPFLLLPSLILGVLIIISCLVLSAKFTYKAIKQIIKQENQTEFEIWSIHYSGCNAVTLTILAFWIIGKIYSNPKIIFEKKNWEKNILGKKKILIKICKRVNKTQIFINESDRIITAYGLLSKRSITQKNSPINAIFSSKQNIVNNNPTTRFQLLLLHLDFRHCFFFVRRPNTVFILYHSKSY